MGVARTITFSIWLKDGTPLDCLAALLAEPNPLFDTTKSIQYLPFGDMELFEREIAQTLAELFPILRGNWRKVSFVS